MTDGEQGRPPVAPLCVIPVQSGHGDVHHFQISRTNGDSLTVREFRWAFRQITGNDIGDDLPTAEWFAEEDR